jgi:hypothetical protein
MAETQTQATQNPPEAAVADLELAPSKAAADLIPFGQIPPTLAGAWKLANVFAASELVPKDYRKHPYDIMVAWDMGTQLGFSPMQALQSIAVINGRPGVWGDGFLAVCQSAPNYKDHDEYYLVAGQRREIHEGVTGEELKRPDTRAVSAFYVTGREKPYANSFSIEQAMRAGLLSKDSPWKGYPERMLLMRARGFAGRDAFSAKLRGLKMAEELRDIPPDPTDIITTATPVPEPQRLSDQQPTQPLDARAHAGDGNGAAAEAGAGPVEETPSRQEPPKSRFTNFAEPIAVAGVRVLNTSFVPDKSGPLAAQEPDVKPTGYYEVEVEISRPGRKAEKRVLLTDNEQLYRGAASCEGTAASFNAVVRKARLGSKDCTVLDSLEAV